ncbi:DNA polymerase III subunit alpha [Pararcticibacter amylolyticus]|uniref:DNA-directed DNA polymerase n=1 Tax=Pararcticibacter amylolyticus TaxID=2173175 RepID=A0A2U2PD46_9SPHI|nr:DNA polymerase III subunit alpha [Pararcticibacter amylolyticus]PWG79318.1 DNA polymerase III subunit alpha [Pararcticibacter amylolyticus]
MYLNVHSWYSLRYGTMPVDKLIEEACARGITRMVLTDINNSTGVMEFIRKCRKTGALSPIGGMEFRHDKKLLYIGIAQNKEGMKELNEFLTEHNLQKKDLPARPPQFNHAFVVYPFSQVNTELRQNEFLGIRSTQLHHLYKKDISLIKDKLVVLQPVFISGRIEYRLHEYLRGIDLNTVLTKVDDDDKCLETDQFLAPGELEAKFSEYPFIIGNTHKLLDQCHMDYPEGRVRLNRKTFTGNRETDRIQLEKLAQEGLLYRYGPDNKEAQKRLEHELQVINDLSFCSYFLITHDIIRYSMSKGYYHVGRGSGANSLVAYCLRITDVDPISLDLYFERFLNEQRTSAPDFDLDFSWDERDDIQEYIFKKYGSTHTALLGTITTFRDRSVIREIGKVMGLPKAEIDSFTDRTKELENRDNATYKKIMTIHGIMSDMPNQRSIHAGGILISEEPITYYTALDLPPKGLPVVQWDMYEAEEVGYDKYDILSQRGIGHIKQAVRLIEENQQQKIDIHQVRGFMNDRRLNERLKTGDTTGCFYIESPAMRQLLSKLRCDNYPVLVAASSIVRPGVASSGMMTTYIRFHHHPEEVRYLHPVMEEQLKETYGVMVYQEDVMKVCIHFAGMDGSDADTLRRGMSGKYRSRLEFDRLTDRFFEGARRLGRPEETIREVWRQVSSFAGYSFNKAHSASFAVESYQSLYLKTYYPIEFMVAVLNNYGGFYTRWLYVHELHNAGAKVHLPCVNHSDSAVNVKGTDCWLGFIGIQGLENKLIQLIPKERDQHGTYLSLENFVKRTAISLEQAIILIRLGALRFTGKNKKQLLWEVHTLLGNKVKPVNAAELFQIDKKQYQLPELTVSPLEDAYHELELLGYPLSLSMFGMLKTSFRGNVMARQMNKHVGAIVRMVGLYVCEKTVYTKNNKKMWFGTFLDARGDFFDTVHFPDSTPSYPFRGAGCYLVEGKIVEDFGYPGLEVRRFAKLEIKSNPVMD